MIDAQCQKHKSACLSIQKLAIIAAAVLVNPNSIKQLWLSHFWPHAQPQPSQELAMQLLQLLPDFQNWLPAKRGNELSFQQSRLLHVYGFHQNFS